MVIAGRDIAEPPPAAAIVSPRIAHSSVGAAVHQLSEATGNHRSAATNIVGSGAVDAAGRSGRRDQLPARAAPAPDLVPLALPWLRFTADEDDPLQPRVVVTDRVLCPRLF